MHAVLFDEEGAWKDLLPITFTRPIAGIRIGIQTIAEKWEKALGKKSYYLCQPYLAVKYPAGAYSDSIYINSTYLPEPALLQAIMALKKDHALYHGESLVACYGDPFVRECENKIAYSGPALAIRHVTDIFTKNGRALVEDFNILTKGRTSEPVSSTVTVIGDPALVFLEKGAKAEACIFNTTGGPIYLGEESEVMEGCTVRGPFSLGFHSTLKMGAKVYGPTTIGPHCKVGGEVNNSVISGYTNKAHDGFLGNSVLGEWCNLGADTNNSNLKNNYGNVKLYNYRAGEALDTGLQFCGLIMGDHSKSGINTMFNTGTVVGVGANIFGGGFPPSFIPSFSWGGSEGFKVYRLDKMFETATRVFERRDMDFGVLEKDILSHIFENTKR